MKRRLLALAAALAVAATPVLAATPNDGFAAFWPTFAAAAGKDDQATLKQLVQLDPSIVGSFAQAHALYFKPAQRKCLAKAHPDRDVDQTGQVNYGVFCGNLIYVFTKTTAGWRLTDLSPDD